NTCSFLGSIRTFPDTVKTTRPAVPQGRPPRAARSHGAHSHVQTPARRTIASIRGEHAGCRGGRSRLVDPGRDRGRRRRLAVAGRARGRDAALQEYLAAPAGL